MRIQLDPAGLVPSWTPEARADLATWADDLSIPLSSACAADLTGVTSQTAIIAQSCLATVGLDMNFQRGKTEALLMWRGKDSRSIRRQS